MTKADRIREVLAASPGLGTREVARQIGCGLEYVRTVKQRTDAAGKACTSRGDAAWAAKPKPRRKRRARFHRLAAGLEAAQ